MFVVPKRNTRHTNKRNNVPTEYKRNTRNTSGIQTEYKRNTTEIQTEYKWNTKGKRLFGVSCWEEFVILLELLGTQGNRTVLG